MTHLRRYLISLIALTACLAALHIWAVPRILPVPERVAALIPEIYTFLGLFHLAAYLPVWGIWRRYFAYTGFAFMGLSLLKLGGMLALLWGWLQEVPQFQEQLILHFMLPYLALLCGELVAVYRLLQFPEKKD